MNDRAKYKGRMAIYAMAGVYLLAQAYYMYKDIPTSSGTDKILMSIFMVVFAVIPSHLHAVNAKSKELTLADAQLA